ncbi:hypothetical protein ACWCWD_29355 [Streptomyces sp. NPDC001493]
MGEHNEDQEHSVEPAQPPLTVARAREMTAGLREAMDDVQRSVALLAALVRAAHAARVWAPLGSSSGSRTGAEFGISRAQSYRFLDVADALAAIHNAVAAGPGTSRTRDSGPAATAALDYGLSQRALIALPGRTDASGSRRPPRPDRDRAAALRCSPGCGRGQRVKISSPWYTCGGNRRPDQRRLEPGPRGRHPPRQ